MLLQRSINIAVLLLLLFHFPHRIYGQTALDEKKPGLRLSFNRQNNFTYTTRSDFRLFYNNDKYRLEWDLLHDNLFNSRLSNPLVQFYLGNRIWQYYQLKPKWEMASWLETDQFFNTSNQRYNVYLGARFKPFPYLSITPLVGYSWDYRSQILDQGFSPALRIRSSYEWKDGSIFQTHVLLRTKYINPRHQRNLRLRAYWAKNFNEFAGVSLGLRAGSNEMDNYKAKSVEQIISDTVSAQLGLRYKLMPGVFWESDNEFTLSQRQFDYKRFRGTEVEFNDLSFNQTEAYTRQKLSFIFDKLNGVFNYEYTYLGRGYTLENSKRLSEREYDRLVNRERQKDYFRKRTKLELYLNYAINSKHTLSLTGTNRYLQYDTPAEDNFDDHDELSYALSTELRSSWSRRLFTRYKLIGLVRQYAFLFRERSQDNYTQQTLRMEFDYRWQALDNLTLSGEQFIYVTYNVKDFPDLNLTNRSTRNMESRMEIDYRHSRKLDSELRLYRKQIHVSYLNWDAFTETTLDTTTIYILEQTNRLQLKLPWESSRLLVDMGYKHFTQTRFQNTSMTSLENLLIPINLHIRTHQTGPVTGFRWFHKQPAQIELSVWWQLQHQSFKYSELAKLSNLSTNYREADLQRVLINFRPFIKLEVNVLLEK